MKRLLAMITVALSIPSIGTYGRIVPQPTSQVLNLCTLVNNWKDYNRQKIRVRVILGSGAEQTWLYDPVCRNGKALTHVSFGQRVKGAAKKLDQIVARDRQAWVILEGIFYGPEPYKNVDPKLPAPIRERLKKSPRRYGHMDSFETMIEVTRVIKATEVPTLDLVKNTGEVQQ